MRPDHYATLGVAANASAAEIRAAYLGLMREYHPDRNHSPEAGERARMVIAAFKVLSDFDERSHYDWDRRRERERAVARAAVPDRTLDKRAAVVGAIGAGIVAVGMAAWSVVMPPADAPGEMARTTRALAAPEEPSPPVAAGKKADQGFDNIGTTIRMRPSLPLLIGKAPTAPADRVVARRSEPHHAVKEAASTTPAPTTKKVVKSTLRPPARSAVALEPARPPVARPLTASASDLAAIDQFVMSFYGQSWRAGDARRRAALQQSRSAFVMRRAVCTADPCRRAAYLKLQRDVSAIVESGGAAP